MTGLITGEPAVECGASRDGRECRGLQQDPNNRQLLPRRLASPDEGGLQYVSHDGRRDLRLRFAGQPRDVHGSAERDDAGVCEQRRQ